MIMISSPGGSAKRKRNRVPLSCTICRKRKVKCDKTRPHCNQCTKTGVVHLCHYMEQTWAEEAEKELSREAELKLLRERVKALEESLSKAHTGVNNGNDSLLISRSGVDSRSPQLSDYSEESKYDNDELDLTRQFDMLHLKNNGTVHLGATHWLAIMKGDPYLKLLWGHLFNVREKMIEWSQRRKKSQASGVLQKTAEASQQLPGRCPMSQTRAASEEGSVVQEKCPITGAIGPNPHRALHPPQNEGSTQEKCPVSGALGPNPHRPLPSFQNIAARCPVLHDGTATSTSVRSERNSVEGINCSSQADVLQRLGLLLPQKDVIALFLDRFFNYLYPVIPIIDELSFKNEVNQVLGGADGKLVIKINKMSDACTLGILTIILRLTWLSLPTNACTVSLGPQCGDFVLPEVHTLPAMQMKDEAILQKYETPLEAVTLVRKHLINFDEVSSFSNTNVNLSTVQFAIFYKVFLTSCPEGLAGFLHPAFATSSQDSETRQILLSNIVQMAFSCGLHRDPDNFPQLNSHLTSGRFSKDAMANTERLKHTWRKIWYYIISLDVQQSLSIGTPRLLRNLRDFSDTKLPFHSKIDYVKDIKELIVVKNFTLFFQIDLCIISVLNHVLNVSIAKNVRKYALDMLIQALSDLCNGVGTINDILHLLLNKKLLCTTEGIVNQNSEDIYTLPTLEYIISFPQSTENERDKRSTLPHDTVTMALFFSKHITLRLLLYLLNYILFTHYEPKATDDPGTRGLARNYAQEAINYAMEGYCNALRFFNTTNKGKEKYNSIFSYMEVLLAPICLEIGHRALQFMVCLILRVKCGPLTGITDSPIVGSIVSSSDEESGGEDKGTMKKESSVDSVESLDKPVDLELGQQLAETLMNRMVLFHKLTKFLSLKYSYAVRMTKSTGFFITLLKTPSQKSKSKVSVNKSLPHLHDLDISGMTGFFKNVPSLILSAGGESLKRCPVYQDAIGLFPKKPLANVSSQPSGQTAFHVNSTLAGMGGSSLPPLRTYQPITYTSSEVRECSEKTDSIELKRRKLSEFHHLDNRSPVSFLASPASPSAFSSLHNSNKKTALHVSHPTSIGTTSPLLPAPYASSASTAEVNANATNSRQNGEIVGATIQMSGRSSPSTNYLPDFEDFLMENSNFNGLLINPSSIVEAVGFDYASNRTDAGNLLNPDMLPIDDVSIVDIGHGTGSFVSFF